METTINPKRGEVWDVNFDPQRGAEIQKIRPALVISANDHARLPLRIVVPLTDWKEPYAQHYTKVRIVMSATNGLDKDSAADAFQIKSFSLGRFLRANPRGRLTAQEIEDVCIALQIATGMHC